MNAVMSNTDTQTQSATTERKLKGSRKARAAATPSGAVSQSSERAMEQHTEVDASILNAASTGKFVLFSIPRAERVESGPVMRGLIEIKPEGSETPVKVQVAAWLKIGHNSGTEYLSLKVGNNSPDDPQRYSVGPFYGRLFRQVEETRTRYFGFIEDAEKTGEDENGQGTYVTHWQLRVTAKPKLSNDQKTHYISGSLTPSHTQAEEEISDELPF
jgi:hypothetical protein